MFCCDIHLNSYSVIFFWSFSIEDLSERRAKFGGKIFQTKVLSRLSHKICRLFQCLSTPVMLNKLTRTTGKPSELFEAS